MKKTLLTAAILTVFAFSSCSSSENDNSDCQSCSGTIQGVNGSGTVCDNGDGTFTVTDSTGASETESMGGQDFETIISILESQGLTCN